MFSKIIPCICAIRRVCSIMLYDCPFVWYRMVCELIEFTYRSWSLWDIDLYFVLLGSDGYNWPFSGLWTFNVSKLLMILQLIS